MIQDRVVLPQMNCICCHWIKHSCALKATGALLGDIETPPSASTYVEYNIWKQP